MVYARIIPNLSLDLQNFFKINLIQDFVVAYFRLFNPKVIFINEYIHGYRF